MKTLLLKKSTKITFTVILFFAIAIISYLVFKPSFNLGHSGDDWLAFFRYRYHVGEWSNGQFNLLTYFLTPYGAQDITMGLLRKVFGLQAPHLYYLTSFFLRLLASFTIYFVVKFLTKSVLGGAIASLFFATTLIGADATNWVFNMLSFIGIVFVILLFYFFIRLQREKSTRLLIISVILYYLAFVFAPIRMHGLPLIILAMDTFLLIQKRNANTLKTIIVRQVVMLAAFFFIRITGDSMGQAADTMQKLSSGLDYMFTSISEGNLSFFLNPFVIVGRFFLPEDVWPLVGKIIPYPQFIHIALVCILIFTPFIILFKETKRKQKSGKKYFSYLLIAILLWVLIVKIVAGKELLLPLPNPTFIGPALLGGYFTIFGLLLSIKYINTPKSAIVFVSFSWIFLSFAFPWFWNPNALLETSHRYLIMPASGMALFWGTLIALSKRTRVKFLATTIALVYITIHSTLTNNFFSYLEDVRGAKMFKKIWSSFPNVREININPPIIIYFEGDSAKIYHNLSFGFPANVAIVFDMKDGNTLPVPITEWEDLVEATTTGENLFAFGYEAKPVEINKIYALRLDNDGDLNDISAEVRSKLRYK